MVLVRFEVARGRRVEIHERAGPDVIVGSGERADLRILDESVADRHAEIRVRRNRPIAVDLGRSRTGVSRGEERLRAPVAMLEGDRIRIGEIELSVSIAERRGLVGEVHEDTTVELELPSFDPGVRRYRLADRGELLVAEDGATIRTPLPDGARLAALMVAMARGVIELPPEGGAALVALAAEAVARYHADRGPHGAVEPRRLHLGVDGTVTLLPPGPTIDLSDPVLDPYLTPERRLGISPSKVADGNAMRTIARRLLPTAPDESHPATLAQAVRADAHAAGLDPTQMHVARAAGVLAAATARPLVGPDPIG